MKRFIGLLCLVFILFGCTSFTEHDFAITNESDYTVSFTLKNYDNTEYTLAPTKKITIEAYTFPEAIFSTHYPVRMTSGTDSAEIVNLQSYILNIQDNYSSSVTVSITNDEYFESTTVGSGVSTTAVMYTNNPSFSVKDGDYTVLYSYNSDSGYYLNIN